MSCCAPVGFRFSLPEAGLLAMLGCAVVVAVALIFHCFSPCLPWWAFFVHQAQRTKTTGRTTGGNEHSDGGRPEGRARQVTNTLDRLARSRRSSERTEKARSLGRPPERREVGKRRAKRFLDWFCLFLGIQHGNFRTAIPIISRRRMSAAALFSPQTVHRELLLPERPNSVRSDAKSCEVESPNGTRSPPRYSPRQSRSFS